MKYMIPGIYEYALLNRMTIEDGKEINFLRYIEQKIDESPNKRITIDIKEIKKALGPEFEKRNDDAFCVSIRRVLSKNGIFMKRKLYSDGSLNITMGIDVIGRGVYEDALTKRMVHTKDGKDISILRYIEQKIDESPDKRIATDIKNMKKALGPGFENRGIDTLSIMLKHIFAKYGITLRSRSHYYGDMSITMYKTSPINQ